ncbi:MAG: guanylate kinase [Heliobacteriaceae bacterium]|jgi:guanylate kinase|nr:guanylate kinase [Heliobacteriaceae bacterium]
MDKKLFVISGSSGVGKGTVIGGFLNRNPDFNLSISCTTRQKRPQEAEGVNYFYLSRSEFETAVKNNEFLEWAEFAGSLYGTKERFVEECLSQGKKLILEIDTQGALQVRKKMGANAVLIFILPPSAAELEARLRGRSTEDEEAIQKRLNFMQKELELSKQFDYTITNDNISSAVSRLEEVIKNA